MCVVSPRWTQTIFSPTTFISRSTDAYLETLDAVVDAVLVGLFNLKKAAG